MREQTDGELDGTGDSSKGILFCPKKRGIWSRSKLEKQHYMSRRVDPKKGGDKPPKKTVCNICGEQFPSKSRLFAHLPSHGWEPEDAEEVVVKTALLVGWLRPARGIMATDDYVGRTLIAAVNSVDGVYEHRAAFSAAQCGTTSR